MDRIGVVVFMRQSGTLQQLAERSTLLLVFGAAHHKAGLRYVDIRGDDSKVDERAESGREYGEDEQLVLLEPARHHHLQKMNELLGSQCHQVRHPNKQDIGSGPLNGVPEMKLRTDHGGAPTAIQTNRANNCMRCFRCSLANIDYDHNKRAGWARSLRQR